MLLSSRHEVIVKNDVRTDIISGVCRVQLCDGCVKVECFSSSLDLLSRVIMSVLFFHQDCHSIQQADLPCLESPDAEVGRSVGHGHPRCQRDAQVTWHEEWVSVLRPQSHINHIKDCSDLSAAWCRGLEALCPILKGNENHWTYMNSPSIFLLKSSFFWIYSYIRINAQ